MVPMVRRLKVASRRARRPSPVGSTAEIHEFPARAPDRTRRHRPKVLAIANHKGGVGKTTVTLGLAEAAAAAGVRVGVIDLDPQADLTAVLHPRADEVAAGDYPSIESCLISGSRTLAEVMGPSNWDGVDIVGAARTLAGIDPYLAQAEQRDPRARLRLRDQVLDLDLDLVLIDLQRSLSQSGTVGLLASDGVLGVTELSSFSDRALTSLVTTVRSLSGWAEHVRMIGVAVNLAAQTRESTRVAEALRAGWGPQLWEPFIPHRAVIKESYTAYRSKLRDFGTAQARAVSQIFDGYHVTATAALDKAIKQQDKANTHHDKGAQ